MTINMQGAWTITVIGKNATFPQRFRIDGATTGNGAHAGDVGTSAFVNGPAWGLSVECAPAGPTSWTGSTLHMSDFRTESDGTFRFKLSSNDVGTDTDFDDLVLECSMVLSETEHVIYGKVQTYDPPCLFNPCYPRSFWVVETQRQLDQLLQNAAAARVLERLYGEKIHRTLRRQAGAESFKPLMIPTGEAEPPALVVRGGATTKPGVVEKTPTKLLDTKLIANRPQIATRLPQPFRPAQPTARPQLVEEAGLVRPSDVVLDPKDLLALARLRDRLKLFCKGNPLPQTLLRVLEYDRTHAEKLGGPYSGEGPRQVLGVTATDDWGCYVFRFSRSLADIAAEQADVGSNEDPAVALRPDLIVQVLEDLPEGVVYESPAYFDVANVRRIDLCFDKDLWGHPSTACQGGRAIQALGDILLPDPNSTLHPDGTVSNSGSSGPAVQHAAWRGVIHLYACFLDTTPKVRWYTIRYRRAGESTWGWVTQPYSHLQQATDGSWASALVGPRPGVALHVDGDAQPAVETPAFLNIEEDTSWLASHRNRKAYLSTGLYQSSAGAVEFRLEGWDASGKLVAGSSDTVTLYLDNHAVTGAIASVTYANQPFNTCALLEIASAAAPLDIKLRVDEPEGFLSNWSLAVYRGSNTNVPVTQAGSAGAGGGAIGGAYENVAPFRFVGTAPIADALGYVQYAVVPASGGWLPAGRNFCAFSFELRALDRTTDGRSTPGTVTLWRELVGISTTT